MNTPFSDHRKQRSPHEQIAWNLKVAGVMVVIAIVFQLLALGISVYRIVHPKRPAIIEIHPSPPFWKERP